MRIVAIEEHIGRFDMVGRITLAQIAARGWPKPDEQPAKALEFARRVGETQQERLRAMDLDGITRQVVSVAGPGADLLSAARGTGVRR